ADDPDSFRAAWRRIEAILRQPEVSAKGGAAAKEILVEEYVPGAEVAVEGLLRAGELEVLAIFDKPDPLEGPFFEETIYITPSRLSSEQQTAIHRSAMQAIRAIGLSHGPVHAEFRVNERGVWPIEVAPRPIGGMCAASLAFVSSQHLGSIGLEELILRHALGEDVSTLQREPTAAGVMMIPVPASGIFEHV